MTVPLTVTGGTVTTHYTFGLKGNGGMGVSLLTADPHSPQDPAVTLSGAGAQTATLTLTAVANTDIVRRTVQIAYGTGARAPPSNALSGGLNPTGSASAPIKDDDAMIGVAAASTAEGSAVAFTVTLPEAAPAGGVTVGYSTSDGRGKADDATWQVATSADYTAAPENASLSIAEGASTGTISIATTDDDTYESDHYFTLTLDSASLYNLSKTDGAAIGTITDADDTPSFAFSAASTDADEDDGTVSLDVAKTGTTLVDATVSYATVNGSAAGGSDFTAIASTDLDFKAAEASKTISVSLTDDSNDEPREAFSVALTPKSHARLGSTSSHTVNITDNDVTRVTLAAPAAAINENGGAKTITVTLGRTLTGDETLDVPLTFAGTATFGADYTLSEPETLPTGVTFSNLASTDLAANPPTVSFSGVDGAASSATLTFTGVDDTVDEGRFEEVTVGLGTLDANSGTNLDGGAAGYGSQTFNIDDDDSTPVATLKLTPTSIAEDGGATDGTSTVTATLSGTSNQDLTLTVAAAPVSPAVGGDYALSDNTTLTIAAGSTTSTGAVTITARDNEVDAPNKTVTVSATATGGNGVANPANATLTITDDDLRGVSVSPVALTLAEADDPLTLNTDEREGTYTVELDSQPTGTVTVNLSSGDTKIATLSDTSLEFTTSDWDAQTVTVTAVADNVDNADDARSVRITHTVSAAGTDYKDEAAAPVDVTVTDDDAAPSGITLTVDTSTIAEDAATATVKVTATVAGGTTYGAETTVEVEVGVDGDSAEAGTDYATVADFDIVIGAGEASAARTFSLNPTDDAFDEDSETLTVTGASGDIAITDAEITITDDDDAPTLSIDSPSLDEGDSGSADLSFKVTLTPASGKPVTVSYADAATGTATSGEDYAAIKAGALKFAAGETSKKVAVSVTGDTTDEPDESVVLRLSAPTNAVFAESATTLDGEGTITDDDDGPTVTITPATDVTEGDDPATTVAMSFTVLLNAVSGKDVTVPFALAGTATAGEDYENPDPLAVTIPAGKAKAVITVAVKGDTVHEGRETIIVQLKTPTNATLSRNATKTTAKGGILDDEKLPTLSLALDPATIDESGDNNASTVTATLSGASSQDVTLKVAVAPVDPAVAGDYALSTNKTLTIAAGSTTSTARSRSRRWTIRSMRRTRPSPSRPRRPAATASPTRLTRR